MVERGRQLGRALPHLPSQQHDASPLSLPPRPPPNPRWEGGLLLAPLLLPLLPVLPPLLLPKSNLASKLFQVYNRRKIIFLNIHRCQMSHTSIPWFEQIALQNICTCKTLLSGCSNSIYMIMIPSPTAIFFTYFCVHPLITFIFPRHLLLPLPPPPLPILSKTLSALDRQAGKQGHKSLLTQRQLTGGWKTKTIKKKK